MMRSNLILSSCIWLACSEFVCFDESQQTKLTFVNHAERTMDQLPTIRLIQGYYDSQWAMQYVAYVYMTEKMGVNVCDFYRILSFIDLVH